MITTEQAIRDIKNITGMEPTEGDFAHHFHVGVGATNVSVNKDRYCSGLPYRDFAYLALRNEVIKRSGSVPLIKKETI